MIEAGLHTVLELDLRVGGEGGQADWRPLGVHLADPLLNLEPELDLLVFGELDNGYAHPLLLVAVGVVLHRLHWPHLLLFPLKLLKYRPDLQRCHFHDLVSLVLGLQHEVGLAHLAVLYLLVDALTFPRVLELVNRITHEGNQPDPLTEKLVMHD